MLPRVSELANIRQQATGHCVLDSELPFLVDGRPIFEAIHELDAQPL